MKTTPDLPEVGCCGAVVRLEGDLVAPKSRPDSEGWWWCWHDEGDGLRWSCHEVIRHRGKLVAGGLWVSAINTGIRMFAGSLWVKARTPDISSDATDTVHAAIHAVESGLESARECLATHETNLGRTTPQNRTRAETMEQDIRHMERTLETLRGIHETL